MSRDSRNGRRRSICTSMCATEDPHYAPAWVGIGRMHRMIGKYVTGETEEHFAKAEAALDACARAQSRSVPRPKTFTRTWKSISGAPSSRWFACLRRARERSADPEVFAGLSHACATAASYRPRWRPPSRRAGSIPRFAPAPRIRCFMLGDYEGVIEHEREGDALHAQPRAVDARSPRGSPRVARALASPICRSLLSYYVDARSCTSSGTSSRRAGSGAKSRHARPGGPLLPGAAVSHTWATPSARCRCWRAPSRPATSACRRSPAIPGSIRSAARREFAADPPSRGDAASAGGDQFPDRRRRSHTRCSAPSLDLGFVPRPLTRSLARAPRSRSARALLAPIVRDRRRRFGIAVVPLERCRHHRRSGRGGPHRGPEPVQSQPANRVRAGRQQR